MSIALRRCTDCIIHSVFQGHPQGHGPEADPGRGQDRGQGRRSRAETTTQEVS